MVALSENERGKRDQVILTRGAIKNKRELKRERGEKDMER